LLFKQKGITLIELLVALVICAMVIGGIYRVFIAQSKAYTVQDQVIEVQQNVRSAMEILLRDLRMAGYDDDNIASTITINTPIVYPVMDSSITVSYEYFDTTAAQYQRHTVQYWRDAPSSTLFRQININPPDVTTTEPLLENVDALNFTYGVDQNEDGAMDDQNWISAANVGIMKVVAVRMTLTGRPEKVNAEDDRFKMVTPRTLVTAVTLRNLCFSK
jgi:type IV pilus assembly protein PilW